MLVGASTDDRGATGLFSTMVDRILALVDIPTVVVRLPAGPSAGDHTARRVLVPVAATRSSRAAEELAYSLIRNTDGSALAVHIVNRPDGQGMMFDAVTERDMLHTGHEMVAAAAAFGERLGVAVEGDVHVASNPEAEIVALANGGDFDLLVIGALSRPLADRPFFGHRVHYILQHTLIPVAIVTLPGHAHGAR